VTSHDGFTLRDLVSYNGKHNEENGEENNDGHGSNFSFNHGFEGPTRNPAIETVRLRQQRNFIATTLLSIGTPMLLAGDEIGRSQRGNNNAYCQDNEVSWIDWSLADANADLFAFAARVVELRMRHPAFRRPEFFTGKDSNFNAIPDISWYRPSGDEVDWAMDELAVAIRIDGSPADIVADRDDNDFFLMYNATAADLPFVVCEAPVGQRWFRSIDTALDSPRDALRLGEEELLVPQASYLLKPRSMAVLLARKL
jgi:glycogen operon protein